MQVGLGSYCMHPGPNIYWVQVGSKYKHVLARVYVHVSYEGFKVTTPY